MTQARLNRPIRIALILFVAVLTGLAFAAGSQAKVVNDVFDFGGPPPLGTHGDQLTGSEQAETIIPFGSSPSPSGIAVNTSGNGAPVGTIYVADSNGGNRVQRFDSSGAFKRAWGENVLGRDEHQTITFNGNISNNTGGYFTLSFGGEITEPILVGGYNNGSNSGLRAPGGPEIREALVALESVGPGGVSVGSSSGSSGSNSVFIVRFTGPLSGTDVAQLTADGSGLTGPLLTISISTLEQGSGGSFAGPEICTVAAQCQNATANTGVGGELNKPGALAIDQSTGNLYVSEGPNNRISEFDANGNFIRAFGWDVVSSGGAGDVPGVNEQQTVTLGANTTGGKFALRFREGTTGVEAGVSGANGSNVLHTFQVDRGGPFAVGQQIRSTSGDEVFESIPAGTTITAVDPAQQTITLSNPITGFGTFGVTAYDIPSDATAAQVQAALEGVKSIGAGNVSVSAANPGGPYTVTFQGALADTDVAQLRGSAGGLAVSSGSPSVMAATTVNGKGNFEVCTVAADCKRGASGANGGQLSFGGSLAIDASGNVWTLDSGNNRFEEFDSSGNFIAAYGWDVDALGGSGGLEKCTSTALGACQAGAEGSELGQFGSGPSSMTIDSSGFIYAIDRGNSRIERFDPTMTSAELFAPNLTAEVGFFGAGEDGFLALPDGHFLLGIKTPVEPGEHRLLELDATGHVLETSLSGAGVPLMRALARNEANGTIYAAAGEGGGRSGPGVLVINDGPVPDSAPAMDPVTTFDLESATFSGTVDPLGKPVADCKFEYTTDQVEWKAVPEPDCASLDPNGGPQAVGEGVTELEPGTHYFVRLSASRYYANEATLSNEVEFTTPAAPPLVSEVGATQITDTSAYLAGEIKARSQTSEYHFEYGTTPALGSSTPTVGLSGSKQQVISQQVSGLTPATTYYLRLVATNVTGTTPSPIVSFHTRATPPPGVEQRAYEMVSPLDKNFSDTGFALEATVAQNGEAVAFCMVTGFGDPPGQIGFVCTNYRAARGPGGWKTRWFNEPFCSVDLEGPGFFTGTHAEPTGVSPNLDFAAIAHPESASCPLPPLDPAAPLPQSNFYLADYTTNPASHVLLAPQPGFTPPGGSALSEQSGTYESASDDWSHIIYGSSGQQTPDTPSGNFEKLFDWHEGALSLVSVDPAGNPFLTVSQVPDDALNGTSADGNRIFFENPLTNPGALSEIYMRQNDSATFDVSESECTSSCGSSAQDVFLAATPGGNKVVFRSAAKLVNEDTANSSDLYLYTQSANPAVNKNLTLLSKDNEPADGGEANVLGLLGMSDDGETVYFAAEGQIVAGAPTEAGPKVYRWRRNGGNPTVDYLATLNQSVGALNPDSNNWNVFGGIPERGDNREVTADGQYLLIHTSARLDRGADHDADADVYRWDQADGWICLSCQIPGAPSAGDSIFPSHGSQSKEFTNVMTEDGQRVFFTSSDALVPEDTDGLVDVYEWHDGTVSLISSGTGTVNVGFLGIGKSGNDVFFTTYQRLVGWDTDNNSDIYDARVGGGFPEPPETGAICEGEACRGAPTSAPPANGAGSAAFEGPGNPALKATKGSKHHKKRHHKSKGRHHKHQRAAKHNRRAGR